MIELRNLIQAYIYERDSFFEWERYKWEAIKSFQKNYYRNDLRTYTEHGHNFNVAVAKAIRKMEMPVTFITPSAYDITEE